MTPAELNDLPSPQFWRRVSCGLYEQLVLLGVIAFTFLLPNLGLGILFDLSLPSWLTFLYLYFVLGVYFVWYWTKSGQTLAMQTWRIRIVNQYGLFAVALFLGPLSIYLDRKNPKERQGLPDRLASTRLVELPKNLVKLT